MATETLTIDFNASFLTLGPDSVAAFESFSAAFGEEADSEIFHTAAKRIADDDDDEFDDDDEEEDEEEEDDDVDELRVSSRR